MHKLVRYTLLVSSLVIAGCTYKINQDIKKTPTLFKNTNTYIGQKCTFPKTEIPADRQYFVFDPNEHSWGAYSKKGNLIGCGRASGGAEWNEKLGRPSLTPLGVFKIKRIGDANCVSHRYPRPHGGALMPYCMFFLTNYAIHGAPSKLVPNDKNITHGCIRVSLDAAKWLHDNFLKIGTTVKTMPYEDQNKQLIILR